jgi:hypothetical protein
MTLFSLAAAAAAAATCSLAEAYWVSTTMKRLSLLGAFLIQFVHQYLDMVVDGARDGLLRG